MSRSRLPGGVHLLIPHIRRSFLSHLAQVENRRRFWTAVFSCLWVGLGCPRAYELHLRTRIGLNLGWAPPRGLLRFLGVLGFLGALGVLGFLGVLGPPGALGVLG